MLTTALEAIGSLLIVAAFGVAFGLAGALLAAGFVSFAVSWAITTKGGKPS